MNLTKTDFKEYLICPKCLWLKKKRPELYVEGEFSLFLKKLIKDGYKVEKYVKQLFPAGVTIGGNKENLIKKTQELLREKQTIFQATFETIEGLLVKLDILEFNLETNKWDIYEVKASSEIKIDLQHNHIKDVTFQAIVAEQTGLEVGETYIIHINKDYRRKGEVDAKELCVFENVTSRIEEEKETVLRELDEVLELLKRDDVSLGGCSCLYKSDGQKCDCFYFFNPQVPAYSVHNIFRGEKLRYLIKNNIFDIKDVPDDLVLTRLQEEKVLLQKTGKSMIDKPVIDEILSSLQYPIYFLDYETYASPVPLLDEYKANQNLVFQYSLHKLSKDGRLEHFEYLADNPEEATTELLKSLKEHLGPVGSVLVWFERFEKERNKELAELHPEYRKFMEDINNRVFDLMKIFKKNYLHPDFCGSASIKNVLPVLLPELSYKTLDIQNGTMALSEWEKMISEDLRKGEREKIQKNLLAYCELDTLAMVEIFNKLKVLE